MWVFCTPPPPWDFILPKSPGLIGFMCFMFSWVEKVTTGTKSLVSFIWNFRFWFDVVPATRIQFLDHFNWRLISSVLQKLYFGKLLRYFNGTIVSTSLVPPFPVCPVICRLNLYEALLLLLAGKSIILPLAFTAGSPLYYCHKLPDVFK